MQFTGFVVHFNTETKPYKQKYYKNKWMIERINTLNSIRFMYNKRPVAN